jgi:hypothetical protein
MQTVNAGGGETATYTPRPPGIILPLGPTGGAGQLPDHDQIATAAFVADIKGRDMMIDRYAQLLNTAAQVPRRVAYRVGSWTWR